MNRTEYIGKLNALYVGDKNCLEELITIYDEKEEEIERLKERIEDLSKINEEHRILNGELRKELEVEKDISDGMLKTIDKAIEVINKGLNINSDYVDYDFGAELLRQEFLEILKGSDKECFLFGEEKE